MEMESIIVLDLEGLLSDSKESFLESYEYKVYYSKTINSYAFNIKVCEENLSLVVVYGADKSQALLIADKAGIPDKCRVVFFIDENVVHLKDFKHKQVEINHSSMCNPDSITHEINKLNQPKLKKTYRILVIEDEEINQEIIKEVLTSDRINLVSAFNGADSIKEINQNKPDLVLLDFYLPDMDGNIVLNFIRSKYSTKSLPVLIISSQEDKNNVLTLAKLGVSGYLVKPFESERLVEKVKETIGIK